MPDIHGPVTGVASLIVDNEKLLLGYRKKSPGKNSWQCPGGLLEAGESVFDCAIREAREETGLHIRPVQLGPFTNNYFVDDAFHSVTLYVIARVAGGELVNTEQEYAAHWSWFRKDQLPTPLFLPLQILIKEQPLFWQQLF